MLFSLLTKSPPKVPENWLDLMLEAFFARFEEKSQQPLVQRIMRNTSLPY